MSNEVSIAGLDKGALTFALWQRSQIAAWFAMNGVRPLTLTRDEAKILGMDCDWHFGYLHGRVMKCDLSGDMVDPWGYDRDNGDGAFQAVVDKLKAKEA